MKHAVAHGTRIGLASCIFAGILMLIGSVLWFAVPMVYYDVGIRWFFNFGTYPLSNSFLGGFMFLFTVLLFLGTYYVYMADGYEMVGGIFVIIISLLSLLTGGGIIIGAVLGIVGGILGIASTRESIEEAIIKPKDEEQHERF